MAGRSPPCVSIASRLTGEAQHQLFENCLRRNYSSVSYKYCTLTVQCTAVVVYAICKNSNAKDDNNNSDVKIYQFPT